MFFKIVNSNSLSKRQLEKYQQKSTKQSHAKNLAYTGIF